MNVFLKNYLIKTLALSEDGIRECGAPLAVRLFGMGLAAIEALVEEHELGPYEAAERRTALREALDRHHPNGYAQYLELIKDGTPGVHCPGHVDYDPASRLPKDTP